MALPVLWLSECGGIIMAYILRRTDQGGGYVANPGSKSSYTRNPLNAQRFETKEQAIANSCPGNEVPINLHKLCNL
jgi:hypothetical protein